MNAKPLLWAHPRLVAKMIGSFTSHPNVSQRRSNDKPHVATLILKRLRTPKLLRRWDRHPSPSLDIKKPL